MAEIEAIPEEKAGRASAKTEALMRSTYEMFRTGAPPPSLADLPSMCWPATSQAISQDSIAQNIAIAIERRPSWRLQAGAPPGASPAVPEVVLSLDMGVQSPPRESENRRTYYLREQMKAIQAEG